MKDEIEKDRAGDPDPSAPWKFGPTIWDEEDGEVALVMRHRKRVNATLVSRCQRVPALEDAYLAACELADAYDNLLVMMDWVGTGCNREEAIEERDLFADIVAKFRAIK